ncbi:MAG: hypothetical protein EXR72_15950 [Myxococcales bacterium]|nr:hypothetical protein [Myxococcales bacterium]
MIVDLLRRHACIRGGPSLARVDTAIFHRRYFTHCMECNFCDDWCCSHGVDVDVENVARILARADAVERFTGTSRDQWFVPGWTVDPEFPGGRHTRTRVVDGRCVFLRRNGRGCMLHDFSLEAGLDYHDVKPMVSALFPVTFDDGLLHPSEEVDENLLVCLDAGPTLYQGTRDELLHYFGPALTEELDALQASA